MKRVRLAVSLGALAIAAALFLRPIAPGASAPPPEAARRRPARVEPPVPPAAAPIGVPDRDIFNYAAGEADGSSEPLPPGDIPALGAPPPSLAEPEPPAADGPRLVGILRRGGAAKAVLAVGGEVLVVGVGESAGGYRVLSVDEDAGVRLADAAGGEITLAPR